MASLLRRVCTAAYAPGSRPGPQKPGMERGGTGTPICGLWAMRSLISTQPRWPSHPSVRTHKESQRLQRNRIRRSPRLCAIRSTWPGKPTGPLAQAWQGLFLEISFAINGVHPFCNSSKRCYPRPPAESVRCRTLVRLGATSHRPAADHPASLMSEVEDRSEPGARHCYMSSSRRIS